MGYEQQANRSYPCKVAAEIKKSLELWVGCVAGALSDYDYVSGWGIFQLKQQTSEIGCEPD
jgi:hypothetical protein